MSDSPFGWDLFYCTIKNDVKTNQDLLVALVHFTLVSKGFKCIGLGESKVLEGNESKTEILPSGWNENYALRYVFQGKLYNLKGTNLDDGIMMNLIRVEERNVSLVQLNTRTVLNRQGNNLSEMIPDYVAVMEMINKQLIDKVIVSKKSKEGSTQTTSTEDPLRSPVNPNRFIPGSSLLEPTQPRGIFPGFLDPVGRNDLDPFGGNPLGIGPGRPSGGGMLFQPPGFPGPPITPGLPPGAIPPGARFDPFRPPDMNRGGRLPRRPDNDEFPPPGYDDMFM